MAGLSGSPALSGAGAKAAKHRPFNPADPLKLPRMKQFIYCKNKHLQSTITDLTRVETNLGWHIFCP
jgi:hypothetical protein